MSVHGGICYGGAGILLGRVPPAAAPSDIPRVEMRVIAAATQHFSHACKIGEGATGEVFRGKLGEVDVAVKRLKVPDGANAAMRAHILRIFRAELSVLEKYRHARMVRLLHYAEDDDPRCSHPFVLIYELLEEGSLADWLRSPERRPAAKGRLLTAVERVDIALGVAHGLGFLHGLREEGEACPGSPQQPALHRDVKSANVGLARIGGQFQSKLLDCGLAKAMRGDVGGGDVGSLGHSVTGGGLVGTRGYVAPEVANAHYSLRSEVHSFGCVLLELLTGTRVGPTTVYSIRNDVEDHGVEALHNLADAGVWPAPAVALLSRLVLDCTKSRENRRPEGMGPVVLRLREVRNALNAAAAGPRVEYADCPVCLEEKDAVAGVRCNPFRAHYVCGGCLQQYVVEKSTPASLRLHEGAIPCVEPGCPSQPWSLEELQPHLTPATITAFALGLRHMVIDVARARREAQQQARDREAAALRVADRAERVRQLRAHIVEQCLTLHCPRCLAVFLDYQGCAALQCHRCAMGFCALCLADCGDEAATHAHVGREHGNFYIPEQEVTDAHTERRKQSLSQHSELLMLMPR